MEEAWSQVPIAAFRNLAKEIVEKMPNFSNENLWNSEANQIFTRECGRGERFRFGSASMTYKTETPNAVLIFIEIQNSETRE